MKVQDLIEQLLSADPNQEVHFSYNYGDHWRTIVAPAVTEISEANVAYSDYHQMDALVTVNEDDDDNGIEPSDTDRLVLVLS
jgi:hypothetical protein